MSPHQKKPRRTSKRLSILSSRHKCLSMVGSCRKGQPKTGELRYSASRLIKMIWMGWAMFPSSQSLVAHDFKRGLRLRVSPHHPRWHQPSVDPSSASQPDSAGILPAAALARLFIRSTRPRGFSKKSGELTTTAPQAAPWLLSSRACRSLR